MLGPAVETHIYHPSYSGGRDNRFTVWDQPQENVSKILSQKNPGIEEHAYNPSYLGTIGRKIVVQGQPRPIKTTN
jgi:hypothetical protein